MTQASAANPDAMRGVARLAIAVAAGLLALKSVAWALSGSTSMLASLTDSGLDLLASSVNALAIHHALAPPDREHRFGHGKLESLAGLGQAILVGVSATVVGRASVLRTLEPKEVTQGSLAVATMVVSIVATVWLVRRQRAVAQASGSLAVAADALHYAGDVAMNGAVLVGIVAATQFGWTRVDGAVGLGVALWILRSAWQIGHESVQALLDAEADEATRSAIVRTVCQDGRVRGVHDLRTRRVGSTIHATLHLEVDGASSLRAAHRVAVAAETLLAAAFPQGVFHIHVDPDDHDAEDPFGDGDVVAAAAAESNGEAPRTGEP